MPEITLLSQDTIDKIAAGEVVERPCSVVKELVENAIDAGATAITVEIKEGGISFIRITDNGCGIVKEQIPLAFLRHSTSKIRSVEDLLSVHSLGFRGEALSSIAAISRVELITKTPEQLLGSRYVIEGSKEVTLEDIGAPDGTTFLVKDIFYNVPARKKFLKSAQTEGNYISDLIEKLALSHPMISFKYIQNNQTKLHTSGNGNVKDNIYHVYGREIAASILPVEYSCEYFKVHGFIGKPSVTRGNRNYENYFVNGRYIKSNVLSKAIEEGYKNFMMQHQYPFTELYFEFPQEQLDVNVHPTKMELRISNQQEVYKALYECIYQRLSNQELIPQVPVGKEEKEKAVAVVYNESIPEPFEKRRINDLRKSATDANPYEIKTPDLYSNNQNAYSYESKNRTTSIGAFSSYSVRKEDTSSYKAHMGEYHGPLTNKTEHSAVSNFLDEMVGEDILYDKVPKSTPDDKQNWEESGKENTTEPIAEKTQIITGENMKLSDLSEEFLTKEAKENHRIIGQLFQTYWLVEFKEQLYIIDQHAAHEKVLYERKMKELEKKEFTSQVLNPPIVLSLDAREVEALENYREQIEEFGYAIEHFGGKEYKICGIPGNLYHMDMKDLFIEMLDDFALITGKEKPEMILEKVASMSCKAAVKGNTKLSLAEIEALIDELLTLENPFHCPHGRPTIIAMSKFDIEKKFKRIVS